MIHGCTACEGEGAGVPPIVSKSWLATIGLFSFLPFDASAQNIVLLMALKVYAKQ